ncbi:hypothetical protein GPSY_4187 [Paraglaciecola psychrophila 170]|nr:hypothetical protein GPSY_4187 [Paraglaciecola psychrophila 170]
MLLCRLLYATSCKQVSSKYYSNIFDHFLKDYLNTLKMISRLKYALSPR